MPTIVLGTALVEVSEWMPAASPPIRPGVYERRFPGGPYTCWNGTTWNDDAASVDDAAVRRTPSRHQAVAWRGLSAPCPTCKGNSVVDGGHDPDSGRDLIAECPDC